jgi:glycerophosphoryl diester phosphodiesterase
MGRVISGLAATAALGALLAAAPAGAQGTAPAEGTAPAGGAAPATGARTLDGKPPLVVGHRGASGVLPEHTLEAYRKAIEMGADFIEPDLVSTKDGVLIARHEPMLGGTTDVAERPEFAGRKTTRKVDGVDTTDWFAGDFTLAEIKTLRAKQAMADRDQSHNGRYAIPTLQEVIDLAKSESRGGRTVGIYPETKHPLFHAAIGLPLEDRLLETLAKAGWTDKAAPVIVQSFETANLKYLRGRTGVRLVQLVDGDDVDTAGRVTLAPPYERPYDFVGHRRQAHQQGPPHQGRLGRDQDLRDGVGPWKPYIIGGKQRDANGDGKGRRPQRDGAMDERDRPDGRADERRSPTPHAAGLFVHTWTFRSEPKRLMSDFKGDPAAEYKAFYAAGIDGLFSDFPDAAVKARP